MQLRMHPVAKMLIIICLIYPAVSVVLMTMGAWDIANDEWDGAMRMLAIVLSVIGTLQVVIFDKPAG